MIPEKTLWEFGHFPHFWWFCVIDAAKIKAQPDIWKNTSQKSLENILIDVLGTYYSHTWSHVSWSVTIFLNKYPNLGINVTCGNEYWHMIGQKKLCIMQIYRFIHYGVNFGPHQAGGSLKLCIMGGYSLWQSFITASLTVQERHDAAQNQSAHNLKS